MALSHSPNSITNGLVLALDGANIKSFRGPAQTNIIPSITSTYADQNGTFFKITNGTELVNIPTVGVQSVKYVDVYNDYVGGSGDCCPAIFNFGDFTTGVSGNTTYTYSIIYKTVTGYTHPNYMYRYEYNGGTYVTEAGVHSTSNRTHLGDGWYFAWGQFTTQASTTRLITHLFHYEYATYNRIYVAAVQLTQGSYIGVPQHMLAPGQVRGATVATGGGTTDLSGNANHGTLTNGPTFDSASGGSIVFDGVDDHLPIAASVNAKTIIAFIRLSTSAGGDYVVYGLDANGSDNWFGVNGNKVNLFGTQQSDINNFVISGTTTLAINTWYQIACVVDNYTATVYLNGIAENSVTQSFIIGMWNTAPTIGRRGSIAQRYFPGNIANVQVYNRVLSSTEILQNFNTTRTRFGV